MKQNQLLLYASNKKVKVLKKKKPHRAKRVFHRKAKTDGWIDKLSEHGKKINYHNQY